MAVECMYRSIFKIAATGTLINCSKVKNTKYTVERTMDRRTRRAVTRVLYLCGNVMAMNWDNVSIRT